MFQHLLLPVDGSPLSESAFRQGIAFARDAGARVTALRVIPDFHTYTYQVEMLAGTREQYTHEAAKAVEDYLDTMASEATAANVACDTVSVIHDHPYEAIINTAQNKGCDLIVMASHGRRGLQGVLIGSETQKVLTHSRIPVLVYR
ncbi:TRAP-T-associated universal stress protein TeaD [Cupriavidus laharis]|uniref:TRAP-T-associated universal stress protein TeaD n=1 Tax=Cupriavidus laharis TaxID=151654 RepID=A0ABM8WS94_9BURK|nr:universal stress protein [Cupriavidus laharis]CAG9170300.1 TRAP-T-associated universal stress protein TeaD [Cupriavidus laharis]